MSVHLLRRELSDLKQRLVHLEEDVTCFDSEVQRLRHEQLIEDVRSALWYTRQRLEKAEEEVDASDFEVDTREEYESQFEE